MIATQTSSQVINIITSRFGPLAITEDKIINFVQGMPGFQRLRRFILIDHDAEGIFKWLQAVDDPTVAFLLTNPNSYKPDYMVPIRKIDIETLGIRSASALVTLVMVCISSDNEMSLNLKGPVLFNSDNMKAMQFIIDREDYLTHYAIAV
ncbi:MAG: flagellar assembly protein FliW [Deltaproteobacteria bacterium]|nr:flagellar assembly protein FliW [Deltaproteobacteria bacterium]